MDDDRTPASAIRATITRDALALAIADGAAGIAFGSVSVAAGLSVAQTVALSLLAFTGGSQFALVGVVGQGGGGVAGALSALLLGTRNGLYSLRLASLLPRRTRLAEAHLVIDESTGMALRQTDPADGRRAFLITGLAVFALWNIGTLIGAVAGTHLSDPKRFGLDAAGPAVFVALLLPMLRGRFELAVALVAVGVTILAVPVVPIGVPVLLAAGVAVVATLLRRGG